MHKYNVIYFGHLLSFGDNVYNFSEHSTDISNLLVHLDLVRTEKYIIAPDGNTLKYVFFVCHYFN